MEVEVEVGSRASETGQEEREAHGKYAGKY